MSMQSSFFNTSTALGADKKNPAVLTGNQGQSLKVGNYLIIPPHLALVLLYSLS
jgi:hypothetical protein